jgi:predicted transposase/invertase (TIGR01784 family)
MHTNRLYKSSVFALLFSDPVRVRELYNALAGTCYDESANIVINTLQDAIFMDQINDISFTINDKLVVLIEHQSTINPNMALRLLLYIARIYEKLIDSKKIYSETKQLVPRPEFIVLYNGPADYPDKNTMRLSDHFENTGSYDKIELELQAQVYNINKGRNLELEEHSRTLADYAAFIAKVRDSGQEQQDREAAIRRAIQWCIRKGILKEFLEKHASEVVNMLITEWNWDDAKEVWQEEAREQGLQQGLQEGRQEKLEIARKLKEQGLPAEQIAAATGLSMEEIVHLE